MNDLGELQPSSLESGEFETFMKQYCLKAGQLADRLKTYERGHRDSPHIADAWDNWMELLNLPSYWLIDQDGRLVDVTALNDLESKVERLFKRKMLSVHTKEELTHAGHIGLKHFLFVKRRAEPE